MAAWRRFVNLLRSRALDREFDDELRSHVEMQADRLVERGMDRGYAEQEARRRLGSTLRAREGMREARTLRWLESLAADAVHGARLLRRRPALTALAVLTLSLGIGANAAIFTLLNAILLRPLPYADPDRLVVLVDRFSRLGVTATAPTIPEILDVRERSRTLAGIAFFDTRDFRLTGGDEPLRVFTARVSASLFGTLGVQPALGRLFVDADNTQGRWSVVVLADGLWRRHFGADPTIVGRTLAVNGSPHTVIGVLPRGFSVDYPGISTGETIEMYVPFQLYEAYTSRQADFVNVRRVTTVARIAARATREQASAELQTIARGIADENPALYRRGTEDVGFTLDVDGLHDMVSRGARSALTFLFAAVVLVLLIACVNTGQFLLAQSLDREAEVSVRAALGAGRGRLFRQFLVEYSLLAVAGGVLGILQALWLVRALVALIPGHRPELDALAVDGVVLAFTAAISIASAILAGVVPALYFSRSPASRLAAGRRATAAGHRTRHVLVSLEVAVAVVLLVFAALLVQGIYRLQTADRGFSFDNVTVMQVRGSGSQATRPIASTAYQHYLDHLAATPGVEAAAVAFPLPLRSAVGTDFTIVNAAAEAVDTGRYQARYQIVSQDFFRVFRIPLREGRVFANDDVLERPRVAIVNETLARRHWPGSSAIGRQIRLGAVTLTIVGVVGDVQSQPFEAERPQQIYVANLQQFEPNMNIAVRVAPGATVSADAIKKAVWAVEPNQPVFNVQPMGELVSGLLAEQRFIATLLGAFAALALFMSASGVYTVVAYLVARRTREIAVRIAIGAQARDIVRLVSGQTLGWTVAGLAAGVAGTMVFRGAARTALRGMGDADAATLAALTAFYLLVTVIAMCVPVARMLRLLDPAGALRAE